MKVRSMRIWAGLTVAAAVLISCGGDEAVDKTGGDTVALRLGTIDEVNNNGQSFGPQAFVDALAEVSEGRLEVEVIEGYGEGTADSESDLVSAIASGELDGGWPSTRAFAEAGISGLEAVEAPMTITSYAAEKELGFRPPRSADHRAVGRLGGCRARLGRWPAATPIRQYSAPRSRGLDGSQLSGLQLSGSGRCSPCPRR